MTPKLSPAFGAALLLLILLTAGCSDNPPTTTVNEHFRAVGLVLVRQGIDSIIVDSNLVQGSFDVGTGDSTGYFDIFFLREGTRQRAVPTDASFSFGAMVADSTLVSVATPPSDGHTHQHFEFRLRGIKAGTTTIVLRLRHDGHDDYVSTPIPVRISP